MIPLEKLDSVPRVLKPEKIHEETKIATLQDNLRLSA
jgi:hypothetical protein